MDSLSQEVAGMRAQARAAAASSSAGRGRPSGAVDILPRAPRNAMPAATALRFQPDNPFRGGSAAYTRYELYKGAISVGGAGTAGMTPQDLQTAISRGFARLT